LGKLNCYEKMKRKLPFFYGWIILAISFAAMAIAYGARNSFSVFYVVLLDEFGWSRAGTAGIFSVNVVVYGITAPFAGALVDRFGPKKVLLAGGTILMPLCYLTGLSGGEEWPSEYLPQDLGCPFL